MPSRIQNAERPPMPQRDYGLRSSSHEPGRETGSLRKSRSSARKNRGRSASSPAAPPRSATRAVGSSSSRCRASFKTELSSAAGQAKNLRSISRRSVALSPSPARIHSHGKTTFAARSVARVPPNNGCGFVMRADLNVQCHDQKSSRPTCKISWSDQPTWRG